MSRELKLKYQDLNWLGKGFEKNSMISPLKLAREEAFSAEDQQRLIGLGVINDKNEMSADVFPVLEVLSETDGYIQTTFSRGPISVEKLIFSLGEKKISLVYDEDDVLISMPANPLGMVEYLKDFIGGSKLTGGDLSLEVSAEEAFVLSVMIDLYRKEVFRAYAEEEVFLYQGFGKDDLLKAVNEVRENSQNFSYHIFVLNSGFEVFTMEQLEKHLSALMGKNLLKSENELYFPVGEGALFAGNFLIFESIIEVIIGQVKDENLFRSNFLILQAGPLDIVYLEKSKDNMIIECMSSIKAIEFIASVIGEKPNIV